MKVSPLVSLVILGLLLIPARSDAGFVTGDYYDSPFLATSGVINEFAPSGAADGSITIQGLTSPRILGLAFGPDGLLYAVDNSKGQSGYEVVAINSAGVVQQTYLDTDPMGGNIAQGKIAFDATGHFYVGDGAGLAQFTLGSANSGHLIYSSPSNGIYGITTLPNGDLLVETAGSILELTTSGALVRQVGTVGEFTNLHGLAYDPASNFIYATALGSASGAYQLMKVNGTTGAIIASTYFYYGDDVKLTGTGDLLVGSSSQAPGLFDLNLNLVGQLAGPSSQFVATAVPEPASFTICASGLALVMLACRVRSARRQ